MDSGALKLLWSTTLILMSISFNLNVVFPYPYGELTRYLSFINMDFLSMDCLLASFVTTLMKMHSIVPP
jgi:hypothetical protein